MKNPKKPPRIQDSHGNLLDFCRSRAHNPPLISKLLCIRRIGKYRRESALIKVPEVSDPCRGTLGSDIHPSITVT